MMALRRISWIGLAFRFDPIGAGTNLPPARIITEKRSWAGGFTTEEVSP